MHQTKSKYICSPVNLFHRAVTRWLKYQIFNIKLSVYLKLHHIFGHNNSNIHFYHLFYFKALD